MHGITRAVERRLRALERLVGTIPTTETAAQTSRRRELCRAALSGHDPEHLAPEEAELFEKIRASVPIFQELIADGLVDDDGEPAGADPHRDDRDDPHEPVWRP